jgi:hypothetical protein
VDYDVIETALPRHTRYFVWMPRLIRSGVLLELLAADLQARSGRSEVDWRKTIGPIHLIPFGRGHKATWEVIPGGTREERALVARVVENLRQQHPMVRFQ